MNRKLKNELVSIILPSYNSELYINDTINCVINQTYDHWELIIADDYSKDNTVKIANKNALCDKRIKILINSENLGAAHTRNRAIKNSSGQYLAFLDADDLWEPDKLEQQINFMKINNYSFTFTPYQIFYTDNGNTGKEVDTKAPLSVSYKDMLSKKATLGCSTVIIDQSKIENISMPLLRTGQDYALWLKILRNGHIAYRMDKVLTKYRITPNSISRNKFKKAARQWQIYRSLEHINLVPAIWYFLNYAFRAVFRA